MRRGLEASLCDLRPRLHVDDFHFAGTPFAAGVLLRSDANFGAGLKVRGGFLRRL